MSISWFNRPALLGVRRVDVILLALVTLAGAALRISRYGQSLFGDELSTLWIVRNNGLKGVVSVVHSDAEISPPFYFLLAWFSIKLGSAPDLVRLPSLMAGVLTIPILYALARELASRWAAMVAAAVFALSPFMINYSSEGRNYGVMILAITISTLAMVLAARGGTRWWWVLYAVSSCLALYSHYTAVFVLFGQFLWLIWAYPAARKSAVIANFLVVVGFLPWMSGFLADGDSPTTKLAEVLLPFNFSSVVHAIAYWAVGAANNFVLTLRDVPGLAALILIGGGLAVAITGVVLQIVWQPEFRKRILSPPTSAVLIVILAVATPLGEILYSLVQSGIFGSRNLNASWPGLAMLLGLLVASAGPTLAVVATSALITGFGFGAVKSVGTDTATPDYRAAASFIEENAGPDDVVVDVASPQASPVSLTVLDVYLPQSRPEFRLGLPEGSPPFVFGVAPEVPESQWKEALRLGRHRRIFFVRPDYEGRLGAARADAPSSGVFDDREFTDRVLGNLPKGYRITKQEEFPGMYPIKVTVVSDERPGP